MNNLVTGKLRVDVSHFITVQGRAWLLSNISKPQTFSIVYYNDLKLAHWKSTSNTKRNETIDMSGSTIYSITILHFTFKQRSSVQGKHTRIGHLQLRLDQQLWASMYQCLFSSWTQCLLNISFLLQYTEEKSIWTWIWRINGCILLELKLNIIESCKTTLSY